MIRFLWLMNSDLPHLKRASAGGWQMSSGISGQPGSRQPSLEVFWKVLLPVQCQSPFLVWVTGPLGTFPSGLGCFWELALRGHPLSIILRKENNISTLLNIFSFVLFLPVTSSLLRSLVSDKWSDPLNTTSGPSDWKLRLPPPWA